MRWEKDWLYGLIFDKVRRLWVTTVEEGKGPYGPAPDHLVISQYADVAGTPETVRPGETPSKLLTTTFRGPIVRTWRFDDTGPRLQAVPPAPTRQPRAVRGIFHDVGSVTFAISTSRKLVGFTYWVGPRYGRHGAFAVKGQGNRARLEQHPDFISLFS